MSEVVECDNIIIKCATACWECKSRSVSIFKTGQCKSCYDKPYKAKYELTEKAKEGKRVWREKSLLRQQLTQPTFTNERIAKQSQSISEPSMNEGEKKRGEKKKIKEKEKEKRKKEIQNQKTK